MMTKTGEYLWFNVRGKVLQDLNGKSIRFAGSMIDITEKKKYEKKLQESYQELEAAYEGLTAVQEELMIGSVSPLKFITVAENTHLIIPLGAWVCVCSDNESETLTGQIIEIGTSMGMIVIAEGVEKQEQLEYLIKNGCNKIQGYLFSRPIPEYKVEKLLEMH